MTQALLPGTSDISAAQPTAPRRRRGRPSVARDLALTAQLRACVTETEKARLEAEADAAGVALSTWIRQRLFSDQIPAINVAS